MTEQREDFMMLATAATACMSHLPTWASCLLIVHCGHRSKTKVSNDGMTPLRKQHDTSPSGLNVICDKYPHTTESCNVQSLD